MSVGEYIELAIEDIEMIPLSQQEMQKISNNEIIPFYFAYISCIFRIIALNQSNTKHANSLKYILQNLQSSANTATPSFSQHVAITLISNQLFDKVIACIRSYWNNDLPSVFLSLKDIPSQSSSGDIANHAINTLRNSVKVVFYQSICNSYDVISVQKLAAMRHVSEAKAREG